MTQAVRVLIVDDSALIRQMLSAILSSDPAIEVVGTAPDPFKAREMIKRLNPDVLTLDIEMPRMNGIDFLRKIMTLRPMPVVMVSNLTQNGANITLEALEIGAVDFVGKPQEDVQNSLETISQEIILKVKAAAVAHVKPLEEPFPKQSVPSALAQIGKSDVKMIVIGASTGGVEALRTILIDLPDDMPPIFVVQHMPKQFTSTFANRLNSLSRLRIEEAQDRMVTQRGHVYIAPGGRHLSLAQGNGELMCRVMDGNPVNGHTPSVDVLFESACHIDPSHTIAVMLSGMGKDGAENMLKLKNAGSYNLGQDERSCVVYGMPKVAFEKGAIHKQCDLKKIGHALIERCKS